MKITIKNIGPIDQAEFSLGEFTILCGENNTGKTYATYSLYGFLKTWRSTIPLHPPESVQFEIQQRGASKIDLKTYLEKAEHFFETASQRYVDRFPRVFASRKDLFKKSSFKLTPSTTSVDFSQPYRKEISSGKSVLYLFNKEANSSILEINRLQESGDEMTPRRALSSYLRNEIADLVFGPLLPRVFIASAERTGAAIFQKELDFARNRMLEAIAEREPIDPLDFVEKTYSDYALPVKDDVDFIRGLDSASKYQSEISTLNPEIISDFQAVVGGNYQMNRDKTLAYVTNGGRTKLAMNESSSTVRSLLDLGFYLRHVAKRGDLLMIDEPELNLHPKNQRKLARLLSRLVNNGIKVFVTTHSDYIVKEINTLIMLGADSPHIQKIREVEKYKLDEILRITQVKLYTAKSVITKAKNKSGRKTNTLVPADINQQFGIKAETFDDSIEEMNRIQDKILYGETSKT